MKYDDKTALLIVDVQNDFADPRGNLYVKGGDRIISDINAEIDNAAAGGALIVYTKDWHPESTPHFDKDGGRWPVHCVRNTWGAEFHPDLKVEGEVIQKGAGGEDGYSGFSVRDPRSGDEHATALDSLLRSRGIESVVVTGLAEDVCVNDTALDKIERGFSTTVLARATRPVEAADGEKARAAIAGAGGRVE